MTYPCHCVYTYLIYIQTVKFYQVDADTGKDALTVMKSQNIKAVPVFYIFRDGNRVDSIGKLHIHICMHTYYVYMYIFFILYLCRYITLLYIYTLCTSSIITINRYPHTPLTHRRSGHRRDRGGSRLRAKAP